MYKVIRNQNYLSTFQFPSYNYNSLGTEVVKLVIPYAVCRTVPALPSWLCLFLSLAALFVFLILYCTKTNCPVNYYTEFDYFLYFKGLYFNNPLYFRIHHNISVPLPTATREYNLIQYSKINYVITRESGPTLGLFQAPAFLVISIKSVSLGGKRKKYVFKIMWTFNCIVLLFQSTFIWDKTLHSIFS